MKHILIPLLFLCSSCATLPQFYQAVEDIETIEALQVIISKDAFDKHNDITVDIALKNSTA